MVTPMSNNKYLNDSKISIIIIIIENKKLLENVSMNEQTEKSV